MKYMKLSLIIIGFICVFMSGMNCGTKSDNNAPIDNEKPVKPPIDPVVDKPKIILPKISKIKIKTYFNSPIPRGFNTPGHILFRKNNLLFSLINGAYKDLSSIYHRRFYNYSEEDNPLINVKNWQTIENLTGYLRFCKIMLNLLSMANYRQALEFAEFAKTGNLPFLLETSSITQYRINIIISELKKIIAKLPKQIKESPPK